MCLKRRHDVCILANSWSVQSILPQKTHRFAVTSGSEQRKRATLTYWCRVRAWPVLLTKINVHLNFKHVPHQGIPCMPKGNGCFYTPSVELRNLWLYFLLFRREVSVSGPMQVLLIILVLWCKVNHDVKNAWQECWGGKRIWCTALPLHFLPPYELLPALHWKFMVSGECKLIRFAYYPSPPRDSTIDHRFVQ